LVKVLAKAWISFGLVSCFLVLGSAKGQAQTFAEWFQQGKTLIKYLKTQIAYLETYDRGLVEGYQHMKADLSEIGNFKNGELGLHSDYYASLRKVSPEVRASSGVDEIGGDLAGIQKQLSGLASARGLSSSESAYVGKVVDRVYAACNKALSDLDAVLREGSGAYSMTEAERVEQLREIVEEIRQAYVFACGFANSVRLFAARRLRDGQEASGLGRLYGE